MGDELREVVYATATDLVKLPYGDLAEGFYVVGTGSTGVASRDHRGLQCVLGSFTDFQDGRGYFLELIWLIDQSVLNIGNFNVD